MPLSPLMLAEARVLTGQIRSLNQCIGELEGLIEKGGPRLAGHRNLLSSNVSGPLLSVIGDIRDFFDPGKLAAYLGRVPRMRKSNEMEHSGHIAEYSNNLARTALVQCALIAKRYNSFL